MKDTNERIALDLAMSRSRKPIYNLLDNIL